MRTIKFIDHVVFGLPPGRANPLTRRTMLPPDYHMHTPLCRHATDEPVDYARTARDRGLNEIGFSDHSPMRRDDFDDWRMRFDQLGEYVEKVELARREVPEVTIRLSLEVDYLPGHEDWIRELTGLHPWDYLIGSVHYIADGWDVDNPHKLSRWNDQDPFEIWSLYFERLTRAASSGLFDIIGHADLPKKFGIHPKQDCTELFTRFLDAVADSGAAIELNTAGLRKDCREIYPSRSVLDLARARGVPITFGSDAHAAGEVGMNFAEALQMAKAAGYTHALKFDDRRRTEYLLG